MTLNNLPESGKAVLTLLDTIINEVKSSRPTKTDGSSITTGYVYSLPVLGQMIDPNDYINPWSPFGGGAQQDPSAGDSFPSGLPSEGLETSGIPTIDPEILRAQKTAFNTTQLIDTMIMVSKDEELISYPTERKVSFAYDSIIHGMQSLPAPPMSPEVRAQINEARKVLYELETDENGELITDEQGDYVPVFPIRKTDLYQVYEQHQRDYELAKIEYQDARDAALVDPVRARSWPMRASYYQQRVDEAWNQWKSMGADQLEKALNTIAAVGVTMQEKMIATARQDFDAWKVGLSGVTTKVPYSYIEPSGWCDLDNNSQGFTELTISSREYNSHRFSKTANNYYQNFTKETSSAGGGGSVGFSLGFFGADVGGEGGSSSSNSESDFSTSSVHGETFRNDAEGLSITVEYGLCTCKRPWLIGDLFYLRDWYLVNNQKHAISDGSIKGQVADEEPLLPMIPQQFLVIRNLKIRARRWNSDGRTLQQVYNRIKANSSTESDYVSAGGGVSIFGFRVGGHGASSSSSSSSSSSGSSGGSSQSSYGWKFDGATLEIKGAQIVAWLSEIVPACAPIDDPGLEEEADEDPAVA